MQWNLRTMIRQLFGVTVFMLVFGQIVIAQKRCTSNPTTISSNINFGSITWTASGGATVAECNNMADGISSFTGDVIVDLANNRKITITNNVNITGNFPISGGPGSVLSVNGGFTLHVTGDLGDAANNGVSYEVVTAGDKIIVDGTLYGKNNNGFTGNGSISGGTLNVKNGTTCGSPCPAAGGFSNCTAGDSFCTDNGVLPVTLISFSARADKSFVVLSWATASELNFDYFSIERSLNAIDFQEIGQVIGHGTTDKRHDYSFVDESPLGQKLYYRLKTVDFDGYTEYFNIAVVDFGGSKKVSVYPNPVTNGQVTLSINFVPSEGRVAITDLIGNTVYKAEWEGESNRQVFPIMLNTGTYLIKFSSKEVQHVNRIIVK
jgi:hypothetical protein